jgi:hypothetical protein
LISHSTHPNKLSPAMLLYCNSLPFARLLQLVLIAKDKSVHR